MSTLRTHLADAGVQQQELATALKLDKSTISLKLSGARGWDPYEVLILWDLLRQAGALDLDLADLCVECSSRSDLSD
jgi:transcriptional regulator with XRE-family HTH domain